MAQNIFNVSGNNIKLVGFTIVYIHHKDIIRPLKVIVAKNLGRDGEV